MEKICYLESPVRNYCYTLRIIADDRRSNKWKVGGKILLGDYIGGWAAMLQPIGFQRVGV